IAVGAGLTEAGDAAVDQPRVDRAQALVVDAEPPLHVRTIVLDDHVGVADEALEDRHALGLSEVQRHAALVPVQVLEVEALTLAADAVAVAAAGHLDLDGVRAPVDELAHARRAGAGAREIEHVEARERRRAHGSGPFGTTRILPPRSPRWACASAGLMSSIG